MGTVRNRWPLIVIAGYLLSVLLCLFRAFDYAGAIDPNWTLALIALTLPWSVVSVVFAWSLIHGAGLEFFTVMYLVFAGLNALLFSWLCSLFARKIPAGK